jgi:hypothetical protein
MRLSRGTRACAKCRAGRRRYELEIVQPGRELESKADARRRQPEPGMRQMTGVKRAHSERAPVLPVCPVPPSAANVRIS